MNPFQISFSFLNSIKQPNEAIIQTTASQPVETRFCLDKSINAVGILVKTSIIISTITNTAPAISAAPELRLLRRIKLIPEAKYNNTNCLRKYNAASLVMSEKPHNKAVNKTGATVIAADVIKAFAVCFFIKYPKYCWRELNREIIIPFFGMFDVIKMMERIIFIKLHSITKSGNGLKEKSRRAVFSR